MRIRAPWRGPGRPECPHGVVLDIRHQLGGAELVAGRGARVVDGVESLLLEPHTAMISTESIAVDTGNWR